MWGAPLGDDEVGWLDDATTNGDGWVDEDGALPGGAQSGASRPTSQPNDGVPLEDGTETRPCDEATATTAAPGSPRLTKELATATWMRATPGKFDGFRVSDMAPVADIEVENARTRRTIKLGSLWRKQPVVVTFLRKLG